jgi:hypothetical protein
MLCSVPAKTKSPDGWNVADRTLWVSWMPWYGCLLPAFEQSKNLRQSSRECVSSQTEWLRRPWGVGGGGGVGYLSMLSLPHDSRIGA